jgi:L-asparaginase II
MTGHPVLAEVVRSGFVEGFHHGSLVVLDSAGSIVVERGDPFAPIFPRSSNKPLQALGMLRAGLELDGELLALAAASHSGEDRHVAGVLRILEQAGLTADALRNTPYLPLSEECAHALLRSGGGPDRLHADCSGKHAAMLATCVAAGWPADSYLDNDHRLQVRLCETVAEFTGESGTAVGVDGCGAPLFAASLIGMARAFRRLVLAGEGSLERRVADAMRAHPGFVAGIGREDTLLMEGIPGLLAKAGAEGVHVVALADGSALAVKIDDGGGRARGPITVAALRALGVDAPVLDRLATTPVRGGGRVVGEVRAIPL